MIFFCLFSKKIRIVQKWWLALFRLLESPMKSNNEVLKFHKVPKKSLQNDLDAQKWPYHRRDDSYTAHA